MLGKKLSIGDQFMKRFSDRLGGPLDQQRWWQVWNGLGNFLSPLANQLRELENVR